MALTFKGGFHPEENKRLTEGKKIIEVPAPDIMVIPMGQHIGAVCDPIVSVDDYVYVGQKIGDSEAFLSVPVHSSVSGKVLAIEKRPHSNLVECMAVIIENDHKYLVLPSIKPIENFERMSPEELVKHIRESGMVGMGGATFPTFVKLSPPSGKIIDTVILNGAECEPYLTADHRVMLEKAFHVVDGLRIMMKILNVKKGLIVIEDNKKDAFEIIKNECRFCEGISAVLVKTKYPQGSEKQIISAVLKREVKSGKLPVDAGVVVQNVASSAYISKYFRTGLPFIRRALTVAGSGCEIPNNLLVRLGTPFSHVASFAGAKDGIVKVLAGGPMMGTTIFDLSVPVIKGTSGILFFTDKEYKNYKESDCLKCGRCVDHCPMRLMPCSITDYAMLNNLSESIKYGLKDCMECGCCSYICPSRRHLVQTIRVAKTKVPK